MKKIRVKVISVYEYTPDLAGDVYYAEGIKTIEDAMKMDMRDVDAGKIYADELSEDLGSKTYMWEVIDE